MSVGYSVGYSLKVGLGLIDQVPDSQKDTINFILKLL